MTPLKLKYEHEDPLHPDGKMIEFVTLQGRQITTEPTRKLFEGYSNYAIIGASEEDHEDVTLLLEIALAIGWAFVSATTSWEHVEDATRLTQKTILFFKWVG